jgi:NADPH:quinone reductase
VDLTVIKVELVWSWLIDHHSPNFISMLSVAAGDRQSIEINELLPPPDRIRIQVQSRGVTNPDMLSVADAYHLRPPRPFLPGTEVSGAVDAVGTAVEKFFLVEDRVVVVIGWRGMTRKVIAPASWGTVLHALRVCTQVVWVPGARVVAGVSSVLKARTAEHARAAVTVLYLRSRLDPDRFRVQLGNVFGGQGAEVVLDSVGGYYTETGLRAGIEGRYLVVRFIAGIPRPPPDTADGREHHWCRLAWFHHRKTRCLSDGARWRRFGRTRTAASGRQGRLIRQLVT